MLIGQTFEPVSSQSVIVQHLVLNGLKMQTWWSGLSCETFTTGSSSVQPQYVDGHSAASLKQVVAPVPAALLL